MAAVPSIVSNPAKAQTPARRANDFRSIPRPPKLGATVVALAKAPQRVGTQVADKGGLPGPSARPRAPTPFADELPVSAVPCHGHGRGRKQHMTTLETAADAAPAPAAREPVVGLKTYGFVGFLMVLNVLNILD